MNSPQERRLGIDGLSRKPAQPTHSNPHHSTPAHKPVAPVGQPHRPVKPAQITAEGPVYGPASVSHPSLPVAHAQLNYKRTSLLKKLVVYPIIQPVDPRVRRLAAAKQALSIWFWLLVVLPFAALITRRIASSSPAELANTLHGVITSHNYVWFSVAAAVTFVAAVISYVVSSLTAQAMLGLKLRSIDHRSSQPQLLLRRGMSNILRTIWNGLLDLGLLIVVTAVFTGTVYGLSVANADWLIPARAVLISTSSLLYLGFLVAFGLRRPIQRAIAASTTKGTSFIQLKSWKLVVRNPLINLGVTLFWLLCASSITALLLVLSWAEFVYLGAHLSLLSRLAVWALGLSLVTVVWLAGSIWNQMYWASVYHSLVLRQSKADVSEYLSAQEPAKLRRWPMFVVMAVTAAVVVVFGVVMYLTREPITHLFQQIKQALPTSLKGVIPKIK